MIPDEHAVDLYVIAGRGLGVIHQERLDARETPAQQTVNAVRHVGIVQRLPVGTPFLAVYLDPEGITPAVVAPGIRHEHYGEQVTA